MAGKTIIVEQIGSPIEVYTEPASAFIAGEPISTDGEKCLVIAAGQGARLRSVAPSKPLASLVGTPLIERVIDNARRGGAGEVETIMVEGV